MAYPQLLIGLILRKEVIQPHLPIRLPCYDFVPLAPHTFGRSLLAVEPRTSGADDSSDVAGGVYKARERIPQLRRSAVSSDSARMVQCGRRATRFQGTPA